MSRIPEILRDATGRLAGAGTPTPGLDARVLLAHSMEQTFEELILHNGTELTSEAALRFREILERRLEREPVARIVGSKEFWSLDFILSDHTLVPRPESESVVEAALGLLAGRAEGVRILDLGTGSGCLLLALLSELAGARGLGTDLAQGAIRTAGENAVRLGLGERARFERRDWNTGGSWRPDEGPFDLVVANPPYIAADEMAGLSPEVVKFDPAAALDGGASGLASYPAVAACAFDQLISRGWLVTEVGHGQRAAVEGILRQAGFISLASTRDLMGVERVVLGKKP